MFIPNVEWAPPSLGCGKISNVHFILILLTQIIIVKIDLLCRCGVYVYTQHYRFIVRKTNTVISSVYRILLSLWCLTANVHSTLWRPSKSLCIFFFFFWFFQQPYTISVCYLHMSFLLNETFTQEHIRTHHWLRTK